MREGWKYRKLGDICDIICGQDYKSVQDINGTFPIYGTGGIMGYASQSRCPADTVIIGRKGNINNPIFVEEPFWNVDTAFGVVPNHDIVYPKFFYYFCKNYDFTKHDVSVTIPSLRRTDIQKISVPVPSLPEQKRIVAKLDLLQEIIDKQNAQLKELDTLAQSIFYDMFGDPVTNEKGWSVKSLGSLSVKIANGYNAKLEEDTYKSEGIMYFRCQNVWRNRFDYNDLVYIDETTNKLMKSSSLKHNDLLITKIGRLYTENSSLGRVSLYEGEDDKANLSGNLCFIRLKTSTCHKFILYILISNQFRDYIRRTTVGGIDKRALNVKQISAFPIILPPLTLQQSFAEKIEAIEQQKARINISIAETQKLFDYTMDKYFG